MPACRTGRATTYKVPSEARVLPAELAQSRSRDVVSATVVSRKRVDAVGSSTDNKIRNARLHDLLVRHGQSQEAFAEKVGVDPKTVQRWVADSSRIPHPRIAKKAAELLQVEVTYVWPTVGRRRNTGVVESAESSEMVALHAGVAAVPFDQWAIRLAKASAGIDILGDPGLSGHITDLVEILAVKATEGVRVRIVLANPAHGATPTEVSWADTVESLYAPLIGHTRILVARASRPLANVMVRADRDYLIRTPIDGCPTSMAPYVHIRQIHGGRMGQLYHTSFESVLEMAAPLRQTSATVRVVA